ncbi:Guanylate cyclase soluble subunit beta-2,Soluble guanylate cyclase gcy-31,Soluble guanylate cyclase gcy-35,Head-specific guanylate cyclase,Receptor-type guanylate cyclase gcy-28,Soluble guanylate cyclase gcy-36,Guanylate cyclase soluble subunit alpha-1,Retinal guanylyl cyclase 2,Heat-stable enterotoxin receptor,Soluble guanylate cyclase 88E,Guanylate cyclase soluble subunit beta-1,Guanylate cyclase soluble subunit alpha-2 [Mytilus coruscus]|uniref:Guanylate cyclase n=1 Tax=Mytilus coruscus TaxID=42192 RepID=A0A6J8ERB3_MYTCO|nr:Guanylate cyclase soluble subunit beta-2,Soluble guanylate cyclase gcy-31,Soluble guanylate cyclase gcy-35,Head-specific guanylate cyclase,Receptor-type guanylate cyclase gcy-28,Soluble guanylate cyclase gcy-36,Guanylate cyclase soluble subunit alpha-1,Retinal guanylyl cyclase 2,Heat-stable enterotoxin receptor,Soluble guanylate cyclase 88E,Guanylate cyclase soluble subunit beta-1,Guanylate cyclase soluble subunit alpha-2 [Mytilus coruscus]
MVWMAPYNLIPGSSLLVNASTSLPALSLALQKIYNQGILPNNSISFDTFLSVTYLDSGCNSKQSIGILTDYLVQHHVDVIIGPPCTEAMIPIAEIASYRDIPVFSWLANEESLDDKTKVTTLVRVIYPLSQLGGIGILFFSGLSWFRLVMISTAAPESIAYANSLEAALQSFSVIGFNLVHHYSQVSTNISGTSLDEMFNAIKYEGRIIILVVSDSELRKYMIHADRLGMSSGDYQFFYVKTTLPSTADMQNLQSTNFWKKSDADDEAARRGFENLLYVGDTKESGQNWQLEALSASKVLFGNDSNMPKAMEPDSYSIFLHDCVMLYGLALNSTGGNATAVNGTSIRNAAIDISFQGLSGEIILTQFADRFPYLSIYDLNITGMFSLVAYLYYTQINGTIQTVTDVDDIRWGNGLTSKTYTPPDTPPCGFYNELCPTDNTSQTALYAGLGCGMLAAMLIVFLLYRIWKKEQQLNDSTWKVKYQDLDFRIAKNAKSFMALSTAFTQSDGCLTDGTASYTDKYGMTDNTTKSVIDGGDVTKSNNHLAKFKGQIVYLKRLKKQKIKVDRKLLKEMKTLLGIKHTNVTSLIGMCTEPGNISVIWEHCAKGRLCDILENDDIKLDTMFKLSLAIDICKGLEYIYKSDLKYHGNLKSTNCVVDSRWTCKLSDFGPRSIYKNFNDENSDWRTGAESLFWTAPEHLRKWVVQHQKTGSIQGDIYSFGIIAKELVTRDSPFGCEAYIPADEIINKVAATLKVPFRPKFPQMSDDVQTMKQTMAIEALIKRCWAEDPQVRPSIKRVLKTLNAINPFKKSNVIENMIVMMEKYSNQLEELVADRTAQLEDEKRKTDALLYQMLPRKVAEDLKLGKPVKAESFEKVTIYFSDIVGFTTIAGDCTPIQVVELLNSLYTVFDDTIKSYEVYKVETIGDAYMVVSGLPERNGDKHASEMAYVALDLLDGVRNFRMPHDPEGCLRIRIGLHSGPVVSGVVGLTMPRYCLFGDTVNTASRMESNGEALKIHMSSATANMLKETGLFELQKRGDLTIKGKGSMTTYWLEGIKKENISSQDSSKQYYSHLRDYPDQEIEDRESSEEETLPDLCEKIKHSDVFQDGQSKLPSADLIQLSIKTPSLQLFDSEPEDANH